jgi:hypothetical protein
LMSWEYPDGLFFLIVEALLRSEVDGCGVSQKRLYSFKDESLS